MTSAAAASHSTTRPRFLPAGDSALVVEFGSDIAPETNARVVGLDRELCAARPRAMIETVPTYRSLMVIYDPLEGGFDELRRAVEAALARAESAAVVDGRRWVVPVTYGGEFGHDLAFIANRAGLTEREVVRLHSTAEYRVYMIGFMPGYTYLGGLPERLHTPRRPVPIPRVEAGSIVLGGKQAAIGSIATPTGWYVLGRTPEHAFDLGRAEDDAFLFRAGDEVRFDPIDVHEYAGLAGRAAAGEPIARIEGAW